MKTIRKDKILKNKLMDSITLEMQILKDNDHPFLISLNYIFQTDSCIHFIMEFIRGGDLFSQLLKHERFTESRA